MSSANRGPTPGGTPQDAVPAWHALAADEALRVLDVVREGLSDDEAASRLARHGPNALPAAPPRPAWRRLLAQFNNILIHLLVLAAVAAAALGHWVDAVVIAAVVVINAAIGFLQEGKAERAMEAIGRMLAPRARVHRDGHWQTLPAERLVPGDRVALRAGDRVPADVRLLEAHGLRIDQAALTGESMPVGKRDEVVAVDAPLAEHIGMVHAGCMVAGGQGEGVVVATGWNTELGRISHLLESVHGLQTPLLRDIARFGRWLSVVILAVAAGMVVLGMFLHDLPLAEGFLAGVALAVAAIPEGLPAIITITLAIGVQRMAARQAGVRRLPAVESLGAVDTICTDKTGTLTRNELVAERVGLADDSFEASDVRLGGAAARPLLEVAVLCNDASPGGQDGDPLERALVRLAEQAGVGVAGLRGSLPRTGLLPFSSEHKFMATRHGSRACLKGAPEAVLSRCATERTAQGERAIDIDAWHARLDALARDGYRVLAFAEHALPEAGQGLDPDALTGGCLLGLVAFDDPPRAEVPAAIAACRSAGIRVKMITGDHAATALAIARQLDIAEGGEVLTGPEIDRLDDASLADRLEQVSVFARTTPEHKLRIVAALQARDHVVAMTGDGANDAPALKRADIGVAMGIKGTEAARQAAGIVLADDNFASIVNGVEEGRGVYDNIRKGLLFILPTNAAQGLVVLVAALAGMALPISPVQILWVNMVTAVTLALCLAVEPLEGNVMRRPPRRAGAGLVDGFIAWRILWVGAFATAGIFWLHAATLSAGADAARASAVAVNALVACELAYLFNARRWLAPGWTWSALVANRWAWVSVAVLLVLQAGFTLWPPAQAVFGTAAPLPADWLGIAGLGLALFVLVEAEKAWLRRRARARRGGA